MLKSTRPLSRRHELLAFYGALCLVLSTLEYLIPKPIPFMRVGLANLPILLALGTFDAPNVLLLVALKVLGQGLVTGTLFSYVFLFSAAGSLAAGLAMIAASRLGPSRISLVGVSALGALASNATQIFLAVAAVFGQGGWLIGPPFLALGTVSGILLGLFAQAFEAKSSWLGHARALGRGEVTAAGTLASPTAPLPERPRRRDLIGEIVVPRDAFLAGLAMLVPFVFLRSLELLAPLLALYLALNLLSGRRLRPFFPLMATSGIVAANLLSPSGRVLASLGPLSITTGALETGVRKSLTFVGLVYLSLFAVRAGLPLPGKLGGLLARVVYYFEKLMETEKHFERRDPLGSLDRFLWSVSPALEATSEPAPGETGEAPPTRRSSRGGLCLLVLLVLLPWGALAAELLLR